MTDRIDIKAILADPTLRAELLASMSDPGPDGTHPVLPTKSTWQRVTQYVVSAVPEGLCVDGYAWDLTVEWRSDDLWAVKHHSYCLTDQGDWEYEVLPSERTEEWIRHRRFPLEEALRLAHEQAPKVCINGYYPADLVAKYTPSTDGTSRSEES